jgi:hypothetical protein
MKPALIQILTSIIIITTCIVLVEADFNLWIIGGVTILLVIGIRIIKRIINNFKFNKTMNEEHSPEELKKLITTIASEGSDNMGAAEISKIKVWHDEIIAKIDAGELKTLGDLGKYIDNKAPI